MVNIVPLVDGANNWGPQVRENFTNLATAINAREWQDARTFYVAPTGGSDTGPGTLASPLASVGEGVRRAEDVAQKKDTAVTIVLAAGTYSERVRFAEFTPQNLNVVIQGPAVGHPNVPTAVFTEGANASAVGVLSRNPNATITVKDVRFTGYRGTTSSAGVSVYASTLFCVNVHATDCYFGVTSQKGDLDVKGGIFTSCGRLQDGTGTGAGVRSLMLNRHAIGLQGAGSLTPGPIFRSCYCGVFAQESATGHVDWATFEDNTNAVIVRVNARVNADGSRFARNGVAVTSDSNGHVFVSDAVTFGAGADVNGAAVITRSGGRVTSTRLISSVEAAYGRSELAADGVYSAQPVTGTTGVTDVYNRTLKAPFWGDTSTGVVPPKRLRVRAVGTLAGTAGTKTVHLRLGSALVASAFIASEAGTFIWEGSIHFVSPTRQVIQCEGRVHLAAAARLGLSVASVDLTADQAVRVTATLASAADSVTFETVELFWA